MEYRGITIEDATCECTDVYTSRLLVTAISESVALHLSSYLCGWSIITSTPIQGCVEGVVSATTTPDGRSGALIQLNAPTPVGLDSFRNAVLERLYIVPHLPTCSIFDATPEGDVVCRLDVASHVGRWGDGYEKPTTVGGREVLCIPIMTGDQYVERQVGVCIGTDGVLEVFAKDVASCMAGAQEAVVRITRDVCGVAVFNYPIGGISGAKVGGMTYTNEGVTINEPFCPSLRDQVETQIPQGANAVIEFPLIGISDEAIRNGLRTAIDAFADTPGVLSITAPSFGGAWGSRNLALRDLMEESA
ncbi:hypothetical protein ACFLSG_02770 [Candidatus Bipolaricaulota bacterium]